MGLFFGTDGLRGTLETGLSPEVSFRCGNALASANLNGKKVAQKILIGTDTRATCDLLATTFASGAMLAGADVVFVGVCPTAGVSYLTKNYRFDYGVVISASHNPAEFNGIKIFDSTGHKLGDAREKELEKRFLNIKKTDYKNIGKIKYDYSLVESYKNFLISTAQKELKANNLEENFKGLKIVLDCSNGSASKVAPEVFETLGAETIVISNSPNGLNINQDCGSFHIQNLRQKVLETNADIGFAFDGDSDRLIAVQEQGEVIDGDKLVYVFAKHYFEQGKLSGNTVVGTKHTNKGVEEALNDLGINLIRTEVGDKYVSEALEKNNLLIGGEQSGHIFVRDKLETGDGMLNALLVATLAKASGKRLSQICKVKLYHQTNLNVRVADKQAVMSSTLLKSQIEKTEIDLKDLGRVMVRASGTEPIVRITVECKDENLSNLKAENLKNIIEKIDKGELLCAE